MFEPPVWTQQHTEGLLSNGPVVSGCLGCAATWPMSCGADVSHGPALAMTAINFGKSPILSTDGTSAECRQITRAPPPTESCVLHCRAGSCQSWAI